MGAKLAVSNDGESATVCPPDDRIAATLLGTALGDALGLPAERMTARSIARRFGRIDRFRLLGRTGFVSDDTEQSALVAQALALHPDDLDRCVRVFRRSLFGWACRLPWGVGLGTLRACGRIGLGLRPTGVMSAGNGAAMRAAVVGAFFRDADDPRRLAFGRALAEVTHRDSRAVEGALYVAELAAACARGEAGSGFEGPQEVARRVVTEPQLAAAIVRGRDHARSGSGIAEAAVSCGTSGFVVHTLAFATYALLLDGDDPMRCLAGAIAAGGDTDSIAAILGAWLGAGHGPGALPHELVDRIHDGPFGPTHLRGLAAALERIRSGEPARVPRYSRSAALGRNLALYPVILGHGFRRLVPF
ncbi:ADP-ribosylglycohydrolase family protein [Tundrisphaera sp. TA3]|uniref:ADP-ribosylglycohydrolase family protein n=1 Tax=Tundrisphaera sp. TA3 TaxID=3435775 RepID=UPI003EBFBF83